MDILDHLFRNLQATAAIGSSAQSLVNIMRRTQPRMSGAANILFAVTMADTDDHGENL